VFHFHSQLSDVVLELPDNIGYRREVLRAVRAAVERWITTAFRQAPNEISAHLQSYLFSTEKFELSDSVHMGRALALQLGRGTTRKLISHLSVMHWQRYRLNVYAT
jgi:glucan biosynthesis protein